jgi:hypothetical protein
MTPPPMASVTADQQAAAVHAGVVDGDAARLALRHHLDIATLSLSVAIIYSDTVIKRPSPLNTLKETCDHS